MIRFLTSLALLSVLAAGCANTERLDGIRSIPEKLIGSGVSAMKSTDRVTAAASSPEKVRLTKEEARDIALKDAGFTRDQVSWLRVEYEEERGIPQYEVDFHRGSWEYSYEIHGNTGEILTFEKDD